MIMVGLIIFFPLFGLVHTTAWFMDLLPPIDDSRFPCRRDWTCDSPLTLSLRDPSLRAFLRYIHVIRVGAQRCFYRILTYYRSVCVGGGKSCSSRNERVNCQSINCQSNQNYWLHPCIGKLSSSLTSHPHYICDIFDIVVLILVKYTYKFNSSHRLVIFESFTRLLPENHRFN
jgi:hypothetical protein